MDNLNLVSTFAEFKELKNIDKSTMIGVLEDVFRHLLIKTYETDENFDVIINPEKGDLEIWRNRTIVEDGDGRESRTSRSRLTDARKIDSDVRSGRGGGRARSSSRTSAVAPCCRSDRTWPRRIMDLEKANLFEQVYREGRRNHHRRGLSGVEEGDTGIGRRRQRVGAAQVRADSERLSSAKAKAMKAIVARVEMNATTRR